MSKSSPANSAATRYRLGRLIKRGGMAEVLEAFVEGERGFARKVAIKRLLPESGSDPSFVRGLIDEARIVSQLHHANIVSVFDFGVADDQPFLVIELVEGADLVTISKRAAELGGAFPVEIALWVATEIAHALSYAHTATDAEGRSMGIVHRDVSPDNILISWGGDVKLADFGIALALRRLEATRVGVTKGKLGYMAPEQLRAQDVDARADLFSLGCVLHWMLAGRSPFDDSEGQPLLARCDIDPSVPPDARAIIARATKTSRNERYATAEDMAEECGAALQKRLTLDARTTTRRWIAPLKAEPAPGGTKPRHPGGALLELALVVDEPGAPVRRFQSVMAKNAPAPIPIAPAVKGATDNEPDELDLTVPNQGLDLDADDPEDRTDPAPRKRETGFGPSPTTPDERERPSAASQIGAVLHGFQLTELIGTGSWAHVYRAQHLILEREYAVKVLHHRGTDTSWAKRLYREAKALAKLSHPNIVSVIDCGATPDGRPFLAMELLPGRTLREVIDTEGSLPPERAARIAREIAAGLAEAHARGIVHRDLKPSNVMLLGPPGNEHLKILDFGIARAVGADAPNTQITTDRALLGSPGYMAPEQIRGAAAVGPPADLYSLGVILYQMLAGRRPFQGSLARLVDQQLYTSPPPLPPSAGLETLTHALLEKEPERRPASAAAVIAAIEKLGFRAPERRASESRSGEIEALAPTTIRPSLAAVATGAAPVFDPADPPLKSSSTKTDTSIALIGAPTIPLASNPSTPAFVTPAPSQVSASYRSVPPPRTSIPPGRRPEPLNWVGLALGATIVALLTALITARSIDGDGEVKGPAHEPGSGAELAPVATPGATPEPARPTRSARPAEAETEEANAPQGSVRPDPSGDNERPTSNARRNPSPRRSADPRSAAGAAPEKPASEPSAPRSSLETERDRLKTELKRIAGLLERSGGKIAEADLDRLESRYLDLRSKLDTPLDETQMRALSADVAELARELTR